MKRLLVAAALALACTREAAPPQPAAPAAQAPAGAASAPRRRNATATEGPAPELTSAAFRRFVDKRAREVRRCYDAALQGDANLSGKLRLQFNVLPSGAISDVQVTSTSFRSRAVPSCVAEVFRSWRTPFRPEEPVGIEYPLSFAPQR